MDKQTLINTLCDFNDDTRRHALQQLAEKTPFPAPDANFNMHCHSFFSYNAEGWSPSRVAYECRARALCAAALCDFDVLDGLDEFLEVGRLLALPVATHLETRVFVKELSAVEISSPGEPGVAYIMGCGFTGIPTPESEQSIVLARLRQGAQDRNLALIARINAALPAIALDYNQDVLPLTPKGVATERHIVRAYNKQACKAFPDQDARAAFWAPLLKCAPEAFPAIEADVPKMEDLIRNALAKRGGLGYSQPDEKTFPPAETFVKWVRACGAIPTIAWLDGTSGGESDSDKLLELMTGMGCAALNIIPDRNWNLKKPEEAARKQALLDEVVQGCVKRNLPINVGTEMNKGGLPFADDITSGVLSKYAEPFTHGMRVMVGQTLLGIYANMPYLGERAASEFKDVARRNAFYAAIGALPALTNCQADSLIEAGYEKAFTMLADAAKAEGCDR